MLTISVKMACTHALAPAPRHKSNWAIPQDWDRYTAEEHAGTISVYLRARPDITYDIPIGYMTSSLNSAPGPLR